MLGGVPVPGYLRWWLRTHPVLGGVRPDRLRHPDGTELQGLYEPAAGARDVLDLLRPPRDASTTCWPTWTARSTCSTGSATPRRTVRPDVLRTVYARLAAALDGIDVDPPERVRVAPDRVAEDAVVLDAPYLQPLVDRARRARRAEPPGRWPTCSTCRWRARWCGGGDRPGGGALPWAELPGAALAAARLGATS